MVFIKQLFSTEQNLLSNQVKHAPNSNLVTSWLKAGLQISHFALSYLLKKKNQISETAALLFFCEMYLKSWYMEFCLFFHFLTEWLNLVSRRMTIALCIHFTENYEDYFTDLISCVLPFNCICCSEFWCNNDV